MELAQHKSHLESNMILHCILPSLPYSYYIYFHPSIYTPCQTALATLSNFLLIHHIEPQVLFAYQQFVEQEI